MTNPNQPWHAHVYYDLGSRGLASSLHQALNELLARDSLPALLFVGQMFDRAVGPHPKPQFEIHLFASALPRIREMLEANELTCVLHPVTDDDLADHTTLAHWIGEPLPLDESVLDPPGHNQAIARFGKVDF